MVYTYTPTYYSTLHDSITSICKNILPFSFKKRRGLPPSEQKLSKLQSDNLKWQQDSFHKILNLMGLQKEGILSETEVSCFRTHLLDTLIASPLDQEQPVVLRDKLLFLQELFYAKCISEEEYHSSKRPLLQRLAVQGAEIDTRDVILSSKPEHNAPMEEWSVIDLRDENPIQQKTPNSKTKTKHAIKQIKGVASVFGFSKNVKPPKNEIAPTCIKNKNESGVLKDIPFQKKERDLGCNDQQRVDEGAKSAAKKQRKFDGLKKWKKSSSHNVEEDESSPLPLSYDRSDSGAYTDSCKLVSTPVGEGPDTQQIKRKLHFDGSSSDFFIDKVLGDNIKSELSRIQSELGKTHTGLQFSNDQIETISTKLPVDKADLKKFFPKSWCDRYGDVVLDVVKKEFKDHVKDMETTRNTTQEKRHYELNTGWTTFEDDENWHPNLFDSRDYSSLPVIKQQQRKSSGALMDSINIQDYATNPFLQNEAIYDEDQNPFWNPRR